MDRKEEIREKTEKIQEETKKETEIRSGRRLGLKDVPGEKKTGPKKGHSFSEVFSKIRNHIVFSVAFFCLAAIAEFAVLELFFRTNAFGFSLGVILKNVCIIAALNLLLVGLLRSVRLSLLISVGFFTLVGAANAVIIAFRGYGIVFADFYALTTAMEVAGDYTFSVTPSFALALFLSALLFALCFLLPKRKHKFRDIRATFLCLCAVAASVLFFFWTEVGDTILDDERLTWDHAIGMAREGYPRYFLANAQMSVTAPKPSGYSAQKAEEILSRYVDTSDAEDTSEPEETSDYDETLESNETSESKETLESNETSDYKDSGESADSLASTGTLPNLIMIMDESYADLRVLGDFSTNQDFMPFYDSLSENVIKGYADSSVYGGYTANSEFEFLTGASKLFLPGNPYLQYIQEDLPNLVTQLKASGYPEVLAVHPYNPSGYSRSRVYPLLGFDQFLSIADFAGAKTVRDKVSDTADVEKIIELYEGKEDGEPFAVFNVTMQNHSPYTDKAVNFDDPVYVEDFVDVEADQYLSLMKLSDEALEELIAYFSAVDKPTVILLFGDHQPHLSDNFYEQVMGTANEALFTQEQVMQRHEVPFLLWANFDITEKTIDHISLNFLGNLLRETAGLPLSAYDRFLLDLSEVLPSVSACGYYDADGVLGDAENADGEAAEWLEEYAIVQYYYLFDSQNRKESYFAVG